MSSKDSNGFVWDEKTVLEFVSKTIHDRLEWALLHDASAAPEPIQLALKSFVESKQSKPKSEWEILEFKGDYFGESNVTFKLNKSGKYVPVSVPYNEYDLQHVMPACKIHSVKRLSDGEVFTVGDEVFIKNKSGSLHRSGKISLFEIREDYMAAIFYSENPPTHYDYNIADINKSPKPKPLFTVQLTEQQIEKLKKLLDGER